MWSSPPNRSGMEQAAIEISHVSKAYGAVQALDDVSLKVKPGEMFGLIGPDGSGKTTLFRIITTLLLPDGGQATVEGHDTRRKPGYIRRVTGYMPGRFAL